VSEERDTRLVSKGDLEATLAVMLKEGNEIIKSLETVLPSISIESIKTPLEKRLEKTKQIVRALEEGYIPITGYFVSTETKQKWHSRDVKATLKSMPEEVKEAWEEAKKLGVFQNFSVSSAGLADPVLVGNTGGKHFFIANWINFPGNTAAGFAIKLRR